MEIRFTRLADGTAEEYQYLEQLDDELNRHFAEDLLAMFRTTDPRPAIP